MQEGSSNEMAEREELRQRIIDAIEQNRDKIIEVAETIRQNPGARL